MNPYNMEEVNRVWQRVQGANTGQKPERPGIRELAGQARLAAGEYAALAERMSGQNAALLRHMAEEKRRGAACLEGMLTLTGISRKAVESRRRREPVLSALRRCFDRAVLTWRDYRAMEQDETFGGAFGELADRERLHIAHLLALIGTAGKN